jgi:hypothetical protein
MPNAATSTQVAAEKSSNEAELRAVMAELHKAALEGDARTEAKRSSSHLPEG